MSRPEARLGEAGEASRLVAGEQVILDRVSEEFRLSGSKAAVVVLTFPASDALLQGLLREPRVVHVVSQTSSGVRHIRNRGRFAFRPRTAIVFWSEDFAGLRWLMQVLRSGAFRIVKISRHALRSEAIFTIGCMGRVI